MRCPACPVAPGSACYGDSGELPHLCGWAASGEPHKVAAVVGRNGFPPPGVDPPPAEPGPAPPGPPRPPRPTLTLAPDLEAALTPAPYESLDWLRRWAAAGPNPAADVARYAAVPPPEAVPGPPLAGWLHVATIGAWEGILRELLSLIGRSGLAGASASVSLGVVGPDADLSWLPPWARVVKRDGVLEQGENSTLAALRDWCRGAPPSRVWYVHTKGASHPGDPNVTAWRDYLSHFTLGRWREAAATLEGPYDACGVDYTPDAVAPWWKALWGENLPPGRAFAGNFFWVRSEYLAALPDGPPPDADRWWAEWHFLSRGNPRAFCFHDARVNHYQTQYPRCAYDADARKAAKPRVSIGGLAQHRAKPGGG